MSNIRAFAEFTISDKEIYRYNSIIKIGDSNDIITAFVLCNPPCSEIIKKSSINSLDEIKVDPTMRGIIKIIKEVYGEEIQGEVHIFNLITLKNSKIRDSKSGSIISYKENKYIGLDFHYFKKNSGIYPYIIIGWGCEKSNFLDGLKGEWIKFIVDNSIKYTGILGKNRLSYLHPLPPSFNKQESYRNLIVEEVRKLNPSINKSKVVKLKTPKEEYKTKTNNNTIYVHNGTVVELVEIFLDEKDILIANGFISRGRYIGVHEDSLGIYLSKGCKEPILTLYKRDMVVYINEYLGKEKTVVIEFNNSIKEDEI